MTKVDFYILDKADDRARERFACKLIDKAYHLRNKIYVNVESSEAANLMDDLLWTFRDGSFIPHELYDQNNGSCSVIIGHHANPVLQFDVLINLASNVPDFYPQYPRVVEIVAGDEVQRQQARQRYKFYRDHGDIAESHHL